MLTSLRRIAVAAFAAAVLVLHAGLCVRVIITYCIMGKRRYNWKERLFFAIGWTPKATVQASLSAVPLALINNNLANSPDYAQWQGWGEDCLATGIFAIIVCATLGTLLVFWLAPVLLELEVCCNALRRSGLGRAGVLQARAAVLAACDQLLGCANPVRV